MPVFITDAYQHEVGIEREKRLETERELQKLQGTGFFFALEEQKKLPFNFERFPPVLSIC